MTLGLMAIPSLYGQSFDLQGAMTMSTWQPVASGFPYASGMSQTEVITAPDQTIFITLYSGRDFQTTKCARSGTADTCVSGSVLTYNTILSSPNGLPFIFSSSLALSGSKFMCLVSDGVAVYFVFGTYLVDASLVRNRYTLTITSQGIAMPVSPTAGKLIYTDDATTFGAVSMGTMVLTSGGIAEVFVFSLVQTCPTPACGAISVASNVVLNVSTHGVNHRNGAIAFADLALDGLPIMVLQDGLSKSAKLLHCLQPNCSQYKMVNLNSDGVSPMELVVGISTGVLTPNGVLVLSSPLTSSNVTIKSFASLLFAVLLFYFCFTLDFHDVCFFNVFYVN
jgi:hypothetical protein